MFCKVYLTLVLVAGVFSLECVFDAESPATKLNVHDGVDSCESNDSYCVTLNLNGIYARGCSKTAAKITDQSLKVDCGKEGCNADRSLCCCKGNRCNGSADANVMLPILSLGAARLLMKN